MKLNTRKVCAIADVAMAMADVDSVETTFRKFAPTASEFSELMTSFASEILSAQGREADLRKRIMDLEDELARRQSA